ncbi:radical SAM protein [Anoxybacteroides tepidamans]|uniref:radical SAM protein n=1 Tax=Anoxybacteroides tepidamans TaxID=265948 RepID=UPI00068877C2|nr:radical SAM protein [Anoxybacillus tepidamans]
MIIREIEVDSLVSASKLPDADYVINPYVGCLHSCQYCYAEFMKRFVPISEEWGNFVYVKSKWKKPINVDKLSNSKILISSVTDPYHQIEQRYMLTRKILKFFIQSSCQLEILTKSDLVLRDIDILKRIPNITVGISINSTNDDIRNIFEPKAKSVYKRIEALKILNREGINTYLFISPIFPELSDVKRLIDITRPFVGYYLFENLNLRGAYKKRILNLISEYFPDYFSLYTKIYTTNYGKEYWSQYEQNIKKWEQEGKQTFKIYFHH